MWGYKIVKIIYICKMRVVVLVRFENNKKREELVCLFEWLLLSFLRIPILVE